MLELLEGILNRGVVPFGEALEPTFLAGFASQLPFSLVAYLLARLLLRAGDRLRALLLREPSTPPVARPVAVRPREGEDRARSFACASWERGRAPPVEFVASG